jgi:hypothetical protein
VSYSSILTIEELDQQGNATKRVLTLVGPSLPFMGAEWAGQNDLKTTWYAGNADEATQQNLGPQELPSTWQGDWRRTMMGSCPTPFLDETGATSQIVDPSILRDSIEGIFRSGRRLRITWATQQQPDGTDQNTYPIQGTIVREGRAHVWKFKHRGIHDIEWEVTFDWVSRGASTPRVTSTRDDTLAKTSAPYVAAIQQLIDAANQAQDQNLAPSYLTLGQLESVSSGPLLVMTATAQSVSDLQDDLVSVASIGTSLSTQPIQVAQLALNHAADALQQAQTTYEQLSAVPAELFSANVDAVSVLRAYALFGPVQDAALQAEIQAYTFYQAMRASLPTQTWSLAGRGSNQSNPDPARTIVTVYLVKDGDTAQKISMRFYNTPDHASDICRANGLSWHTNTFPKGKPLVIPVISSSTQSV